jgi:hypothetical protein
VTGKNPGRTSFGGKLEPGTPHGRLITSGASWGGGEAAYLDDRDRWRAELRRRARERGITRDTPQGDFLLGLGDDEYEPEMKRRSDG